MTNIQKMMSDKKKPPKEIIDQIFVNKDAVQCIIDFGNFVLTTPDVDRKYSQLLQAILRQLNRLNNQQQVKQVTQFISDLIFSIPNKENEINLSRRYISLTILFILISYYGVDYVIQNDTYINECYACYELVENLSQCEIQQKMCDLIAKLLLYNQKFDIQAVQIKQTRLYKIIHEFESINTQEIYTYFELYTILQQAAKQSQQLSDYKQIFTENMLRQYLRTDLINQSLFKNRNFIKQITETIKPLIQQHLERKHSKSYPSIYQLYVYVENKVKRDDMEVYFNLLVENEINYQYIKSLQNIILHFNEQIAAQQNTELKQQISQKKCDNYPIMYITEIFKILLSHYADKIFLKHDVLFSQLFSTISFINVDDVTNVNELIYLYYIAFLILYEKKNTAMFEINIKNRMYNCQSIYDEIVKIYTQNPKVADIQNVERLIQVHIKMKKNVSFDLLAKSISCLNSQQLKKELLFLKQEIKKEDFIIENYDVLQLLTEFCSSKQLEQLLIWANTTSIVNFPGLVKRYFAAVQQDLKKKEMFFNLFLTDIDTHISFTISNTFNYLDISQLIGILAFELNKTMKINQISYIFKFQQNFELKLRDMQELFQIINNPQLYIQDYISLQCIMPIVVSILFEQMQSPDDFKQVINLFYALFYHLSYFLDFCFQRPDDEMIENEIAIKKDISFDQQFQQLLTSLMPIPSEVRPPLPTLTSSVLDEADRYCQFLQQQMMSTVKILVKYLTGLKFVDFAINNNFIPELSKIQSQLLKFCFKCNIGPTRNKLVLHIFNDTNLLLKTQEMETIFVDIIQYILDSAFLKSQRFSARRRTENVQKAFGFMIKYVPYDQRKVIYERILQELEKVNESTDSIKIAQILNFLQVCQDILKWDVLITILNNDYIMLHNEYAVSNGVAGILQYYHLFALNRHYIHLTNTQLQKICVLSGKKADIIRCIVLSKCLFDQNSSKARDIVKQFLNNIMQRYNCPPGRIVTKEFYMYQNGQFKILSDKINKCLQFDL